MQRPWHRCGQLHTGHLVITPETRTMHVVEDVNTMQALPILQERFPHHWIFQLHPIFLPGAPDHVRREWESWCTLTTEVYHSAVQHMYVQAECGKTMSDLIVWRPSTDLQRRAQAIRATWTPVHACMQLLSDPCAQAVLTKVCSHADTENVLSHQCLHRWICGVVIFIACCTRAPPEIVIPLFSSWATRIIHCYRDQYFIVHARKYAAL